MTDKEWLLNPSAIQKAKECIHLIQTHLGVRLRLTHPNFLAMIADYAEMTESRDLQLAYIQLAKMAGIDVSFQNREPQDIAKVVNMPFMEASTSQTSQDTRAPSAEMQRDDSIDYHGKTYPRFNADGLEFKGLYRGQARYG